MWIKKSNQELKGELRARRVAAGLCALTATFLVCVFGLSQAGFIFATGGRLLAVLVAGAMLLVWYRNAHKRRLRSNVRVCEQCNLVKLQDRQEACICGGRFASMCEMKWLEKPALTDDRSLDPIKGTMSRPSHAV
jgi:hypothetical protein